MLIMFIFYLHWKKKNNIYIYMYTYIKSDRHYERGVCYVARQNATIPFSRMEYVATNIYISNASLSAGYGSRFFSAPLVARFQFPDR